MAKVLIVDDDPDVVEAVRLCLEKAGHQTASAGNREDGLKMALAGQPDLMVLDIMMTEPDDGLALAQELRRSGFGKPILMMSSISKVTGLNYGKDAEVAPVNDFVEKPVRPDVLVNKVNDLLKA